MKELPAANSPRDRDQEAALWYLSLAEGELSGAEREAFDLWILDPDNLTAIQDVVRAWGAAGATAGEPELIGMRGAALESYRRANEKHWVRQPLTRLLSGIAAVLIVALTAWFLTWQPVKVYQTGIAERQVAMLDDHSRLSLDADSKVEVRLGSERRKLKLLRGRARFDVAHDSLRPFAVEAGRKLVVATGTSFSVELINGQVRVLLYEGHVEVKDSELTAATSGRARRMLTPGRELIIPNAVNAAPKLVEVDPIRTASWENGQLSFDDEPVTLAVARMNRYARVKLAVDDGAASKTRISGVFTAGDTEAFVEGVTALTDLHAKRSPSQVTLTTR